MNGAISRASIQKPIEKHVFDHMSVTNHKHAVEVSSGEGNQFNTRNYHKKYTIGLDIHSSEL